MIKFYRSFGIHAKLKHPMKLFAHLNFDTAAEILFAVVIIMWGGDMFTADKSYWPEVIYYISSAMLACYLLFPTTRSNPGKKNLDLIILTFTPTIRFFQSINQSSKKPLKIDNRILARMPKTINYRHSTRNMHHVRK